MNCSCPDWAVPCKHLAAVIYLIASEIDLNPLLVFELHNFKPIEKLKKKETDISQNIKEKFYNLKKELILFKKEEIINFEEIKKYDFSKIQRTEDKFLKLLSENPPFYYKNFKELLLKYFSSLPKN